MPDKEKIEYTKDDSNNINLPVLKGMIPNESIGDVFFVRAELVQNDTSYYVADKTFNEIVGAIKANKFVVLTKIDEGKFGYLINLSPTPEMEDEGNGAKIATAYDVSFLSSEGISIIIETYLNLNPDDNLISEATIIE